MSQLSVFSGQLSGFQEEENYLPITNYPLPITN